jgi:hypothetical protein
MAAERAAEPILGYSSTGNFDPTNIPPALQFLLDDYRDQLEFIDSKHLHPTPQITQKWNNLTETSTAENTVIVQPLIKTKWGQGQYYNSQCPTGGLTYGQCPHGLCGYHDGSDYVLLEFSSQGTNYFSYSS